ncbi:hypothetical protein [Streptacidiphilus sp. EB129]|uniref:hypothetical protein n=1 Tax=Streptacidiphilus sp. EB129 TaxID=3156262 RepID=UPI0035140A92
MESLAGEVTLSVPYDDVPQAPAERPVSRRAGILHILSRSLLTRAATLPLTALTALASARTVVDAVGVPGYALVTLITSLPAVLPIGDLGAGAAITEAVAGQGGDRDPVRGTLASSGRTLSHVAALIVVAGTVPAAFGAWSLLLGGAAGAQADTAVAVASVFFACTLPLGLGRSLLAAVNRTHTVVLLQAATGFLTLALTLSVAALHLPAAAFIAAGFLAQCGWGAACLLLAGRHLGIPALRIVLTSARGAAGAEGARVRRLAAPMAVISAASAVAYSTDRIVLSHTTGAAAVAAYSAGAQLFVPASSLVGAAGLPLWVHFARRRHTGEDSSPRRHLMRLTAAFALGGQSLGLGLVLAGPAIATWITHGRVHVGTALMLCFAALLFVQALDYPASMWLTDAAGLRFQATRAVVMATANLALSVPLAYFLGPPGPVLASFAAYAVAVAAPTLRRAMTDA